LLGGVTLQFVHIEFARIARHSRRFVFSLDAAFGLVALFLLARVFFLAFGKAGSSSSGHSNLQSSNFGNSGLALCALVKFAANNAA
jgi:hypothetical protein